MTLDKVYLRTEQNSGDVLFVCTEKEQFCLLKYSEQTVVTLVSGSLHDRACRPIERGQLIAIDKTMIVLHMVQGLVKILPIESKYQNVHLREIQNCRIEELQVLDMVMTREHNESILVLLNETYNGGRSLSTYRFVNNGKIWSLEDGPWKFEDLEMDSNALISVPQSRGGLLVIADESIFYYNHVKKSRCAVAMNPTRITWIDDDGHRYLLADSDGGLYILILFTNGGGQGSAESESLKLEYLGKTVIASTLTYLDNGYVLVGSQFGDSQVIRLSRTRLVDGHFVEIIDRFKSLAPIVDFAVVDVERIGQNSVITCSGAYKEGSLRVIRKGSNVTINSIIQLDAVIKRVFMLKHNNSSYLFLSTLFTTQILEMKEDGIVHIEPSEEFLCEEPTLLIGHVGIALIQVTPTRVSIIKNGQYTLWRPSNRELITCVSGCEEYLMFSTSGRRIFWLKCSNEIERPQILGGELTSKEVSALCIFRDSNDVNAAISFWNDDSLYFFEISSCKLRKFGGFILEGAVRSLEVFGLGGKQYLFFGLGNGALGYFEIGADEDRFTPMVVHRAMLGNEPVQLQICRLGNQRLLLTSANRPFIISFVRGRVNISLTNMKDIRALCGDEATNTNQLVVAKDDGLYFCSMESDDKSSLHHQAYPIGETATKIIHFPSAKAYVILTTDHRAYEMTTSDPNNGIKSHVQLVDQDTFMRLDCYEMPEKERAHSLTSFYMIAQNTEAVIVGSAIQRNSGEEPQEGRILTFIVNPNRKLQLISQTSVPGCIYAISPINGKLVATINGMTSLYKWSRADGESNFAWRHLHSHFGQILGVRLDVSGNLIIVGDLMKSVNLLTILPSGEKLTEIARDYEPNWMTELHFVNDDTILGADNLGNLFVLGRRVDEHFSNAQWSMTIKSAFHLGEVVNKIGRGTLVRSHSDAMTTITNQMLIGTTSGSLYLFGVLSPRIARMLKTLERNLEGVIETIGGFDHTDWRRMITERKKPKEVETFVDGDLIARYLELPVETQKLVVEGGNNCVDTGYGIQQVTQMVESLIVTHQ